MTKPRGKKPVDPEVAAKIARLFSQGLETPALCERFGLSNWCVNDVLKRAGLK